MKPLVFFLLMLPLVASAWQNTGNSPLFSSRRLSFDYLTVNNGLSQNSVTSVIQDRQGFIWIGTWDGLNKYDGISVTSFRHKAENNHTLSDNRISCLYEDDRGHILAGTQSGDINDYDPSTGKFTQLDTRKRTSEGEDVRSLCTDLQGNLWVGTNSGLFIVKKSNGAWQRLLESQAITQLLKDRQGNIWVGTYRGLYLHKTASGAGQVPDLHPIPQIAEEYITALFEDRKGRIWMGEKGHLASLEPVSNAGESWNKKIYLSDGDLPGKTITSIQQDKEGGYWIGTNWNGVVHLTIDRNQEIDQSDYFNTIAPFCEIPENAISTLLIDQSGVLWAGCMQKGICYTDLSRKKFFAFEPLLSGKKGELGYKGKFTTAVCQQNQTLWIGTADEGLYGYDLLTGGISRPSLIGDRWVSSLLAISGQAMFVGSSEGLYRINAGKTTLVLPRFNIHGMAEDHFKRLWITTWEGVYIYDPVKETLDSVTTRDGLSSNRTFEVCADPTRDLMWVSTIGKGLNRIAYSPDKKTTVSSLSITTSISGQSITSNYIWAIYRKSNGEMWLGTDAGLDMVGLDEQGNPNRIRHYLSNQKIVSIQEDGAGHFWLGNSQGLLQFSPATGSTEHYTFRDGLQSNTFTEASFKNNQGILFFGGINGLNYFDPKTISRNTYPAKTAFTSLKIFNREIHPGDSLNGHVLLNKEINQATTLRLSHKENHFAISFAAMHYASPGANRFKYRLSGYDQNWNSTDNGERTAAYSNLPAGHYELLVSSSNNDGIWSEEVHRLKIIIEPAPWLTWWAKLCYSVAVAGLVLLILRHFRRKRVVKNILYQERLEKEKITELNDMKLSFFTSITHELRTPLNLITGPAAELLKSEKCSDEFTRLRVQLIQNNANRLSTLVNQVLDLRKLSATGHQLNVSVHPLISTITSIKNRFNWLATQKGLSYYFDFERPVLPTWFDPDKLEKILTNLLDNAFKHTQSGEIRIQLTIEDTETPGSFMNLKVSDTGTGIADHERQQIFDMFYQGAAGKTAGTGIGLSLVKMLTELHHGTVCLNSSVGKGAAFTVRIPLNRDYYSASEIIEPVDEPAPAPAAKQGSKRAVMPQERERSIVLLVEDNPDQRAYIKDHIAAKFDVLEAADGQEGFVLAEKFSPDLIVSDLMMEGMDGFSLCKKLKENARTRAIPIIIHSIRINSETQQQAFEAGADDYIEKPCDYHLLTLKISNRIDSGRQLSTDAYRQTFTDTKLPEQEDADTLFLKKVTDIIEANIAEYGFTVEELSRQACVSRMHLHRRVHEISGKTSSELIREMRMKRAAALLKTGTHRIAEVMAEVGISNHHLFNKYFKDMYGMTPREYGKQDAG